MTSDDREVALALARIEGMLNATLPELSEKHRNLSAEVTILHGRTTDTGRKLAAHQERIADLEEKTSGQLGRTAQIVAVLGGVLGILALILPALAGGA